MTPLFLNNAQHVLAHPSALFTERVLLFFRPLFQLWVTVLYALFATEPRGYFVAAILLHALTAFLVWRVALRLLVRPVAAACAAAAFTVLYSQSGALMWVAAHASVLVCLFAVATLLSHLDACSAGGAARSWRTAALAVAMLLSKESGLYVLAWLPLAEWRVRGFRACLQRRSLLRYAGLALIAAVYLVVHPRVLLEGFSGAAGSQPASALRYITPERIFGAALWLDSPIESHAKISRRGGAR